jgi:hypothetical protein
MKTTTKIFMLLLAMGLTLAACSKDDEKGEVKVKVTDAPFPFQFVTEANVRITKVELINENNDYVTVFEGNTAINLVNYRNGETANLSVQAIPPGTYNKVKVTIEGAEVTLSNGISFQVQAGLGGTVTTIIAPELVVEEDDDQEILLDIDLSDSFVFSGNFMGGWITAVSQITGITSFNPDVRVANLEASGSIEGEVKDQNGEGVAYAEVYVMYDYNGDGMPEKVSTVTEEDGEFEILGLPEGSYNVVINAKDAPEVTVNVNVEADSDTDVEVEVQVTN